MFHDAGTHRIAEGNGGANGSIRYELDRPENYGLNRGWRVINDVMTSLKGTIAEGRVSLADLVYLGGAYAVAVTGGPSIEVPIGKPAISGSELFVFYRIHVMAQHTCVHQCPASLFSSKLIRIRIRGTRPAATTAGRLNADVPDPAGRLPKETFTSQQLLDSFAASGLTSREFVALSGAHTVCCCSLLAAFFDHKLDAQHSARAIL